VQSIRKKSFAAEQLARQKKTNPVVWVLVGVFVVLLVVGGYVMYQRSVQEKVETETQQIKSIAVLPFRDMSPKKDQEYLGDGIAETIINTLTKIEGIQVPASTSSSAFKGKDLSIIEIGKQLNVETILEGTVQKEGNLLRVTAQLIKVTDGFHLWSELYEREFDSIFAIQDSISYAIVEELKGKLPGDEKAVIEKRYTEDVEAWDLYLQGRYYWNERSENGYTKALLSYRKAIEKDPDYALAYAGIADTFNLMAHYGIINKIEGYQNARVHANKALEIDDSLSEAFVSLAWINIYYDWDWVSAQRNLTRAVELNPGNSQAYHFSFDYYSMMRKFDKALLALQHASELDPMTNYHGLLITAYGNVGNYDEAMHEFEKAIVTDSKHFPYARIGDIYIKMGNYKEAINVLQSVDSNFGNLFLGYAYGKSGEREKAEQVLNMLITRNEKNIDNSVWISCIYVSLDDIDNAFDWMGKAYENKVSYLPYINIFSPWNPIRSDPRFKALLKKMGLPED